MKKIITLAAVGIVLLSACKNQTYHCTSINVEQPGTLDIKANDKHIRRYTTPTKVGDTILVWQTATTGSNYIVKEIR